MAAPEDPRMLADQVRQLIRTAHRHISEGRQVDVTAVQTLVARLVAAVDSAPAVESAVLREGLTAILADLSTLETAYRRNPPGEARASARAASDAYASSADMDRGNDGD
ncbi:MAG: hypothetical protein ACPGO3_05730 [Magnetospiraceae bacterium]